MLLSPPVTVCQNCGTRAAETVCHTCKAPRPIFASIGQPAPAEAVCYDVFAEIDKFNRLFYPPKTS